MSPVLRPVTETNTEETFRHVLATAIDVITDAGIPYVLIGGVGSASLGRPRWTRDIDVLVAPIDADRTLDVLADKGFDTERTNDHWIFKATMDGIVVDVIFKAMGDIYLHDGMLERARPAEFLGVTAMIAPPEDMIVIKALAHDEQSARHWNDALSLIASCDLDWDYLLERANLGPRRVMSLLVYAQSNDLIVPDSVIARLFEQIYRSDGTNS